MEDHAGAAARPLETGPEFCLEDGLYLSRVTELEHKMSGGVRVRLSIKGMEEDSGGAEYLITASSWASAIAAVTPEGDNATTFRIAQGFHGAQ